MTKKEEIEYAFKDYLDAKGYYCTDFYPNLTYFTGHKVVAMLYGHNVNVKDFSRAERRGPNTWVSLSRLDARNTSITGNLFKLEQYEW